MIGKVSADVPQGPGPQIQTNSSLDDGVFNKAFLLQEGRYCKLGAKHLAGIILSLITTAK